MRKIVFLLLVLLIFSDNDLISAHPLGNFSVNQFSRIEVEKNQVRVHQVLDLAEIPTFQESNAIDADKNGQLSQIELNAYLEKITADYVANLEVLIGNSPVQLRVASKEIELQNGAANLPTLRISWAIIGDLPVLDSIARLRFENKNNQARVGWNEIVVSRAATVNIFDCNVFSNSLSNELREYPEDLLTAPLLERRAEFSLTLNSIPVNAKPLQTRDGKVAAVIQKDRLAELINVPEITIPVALFGLLIAFGLGAAHALSPGHGKTVVGAYLVGSRGTLKHAAFLGLTVTITHTLGVFALGLFTLFAANFILPERLIPFLNFVSGLLIFFIGIALFKNRLFNALGRKINDQYVHHHLGEHSDNHSRADEADEFTHTHNGHTHTHKPPETVSWSSLLGLGISGGLLPCPSALVLMLGAISLGRIGYGLILTVFFSLGLAATLMCVGLIFLSVGKIFEKPSLSDNRIVKTLPIFSAFVIACVGAVICYNSVA